MTLSISKISLDAEFIRLKKIIATRGSYDTEDFDLRGELYRMSALFGKSARDEDLVYMKHWIMPREGEMSVDIAAGTGFITKPLAEWTKSNVYAIDPSDTQLKNCAIKCAGLPVKTILGSLSQIDTLEKLGTDFGRIDIVTSFGGIHHIVGMGEQNKMFINVSKCLRKNGRFIGADVGKNTSLATWFSTIVKNHCLTGHNEQWLSSERFRNELLADTNLRCVKSEIIPIKWYFESKTHMALFIKALNALDLGENEIISYLHKILGFDENEGKVSLNWPMLFFHLEKI